jgi:hypothetical protein
MGREEPIMSFSTDRMIQGGRKPDLERVQRALGVAERERPLLSYSSPSRDGPCVGGTAPHCASSLALT